jgi:hypothetical protein
LSLPMEEEDRMLTCGHLIKWTNIYNAQKYPDAAIVRKLAMF